MGRSRTHVVALLAVVAGFGSIHLPPAAASERQALIGMINDARTRAGLPRLAADGALSGAAQAHAERLAAAGKLEHSKGLAAVVGARGGENVGVGPDAGAIHRAFMASSTHRSNILSAAFERVGTGTAGSPFGIFAVQIFAGGGGGRTAPDAASAPQPRTRVNPRPPERPGVRTARPARRRTPPPEPAPAPPPEPPRLYPDLDTELVARMLRWEADHMALPPSTQ